MIIELQRLANHVFFCYKSCLCGVEWSMKSEALKISVCYKRCFSGFLFSLFSSISSSRSPMEIRSLRSGLYPRKIDRLRIQKEARFLGPTLKVEIYH